MENEKIEKPNFFVENRQNVGTKRTKSCGVGKLLNRLDAPLRNRWFKRLRFPNFDLGQNLSPSTLADFISGYLIFRWNAVK